ncbi:gamma-glutamyl-gamma-aminobutyrate hydrolase family protein [Saccharothrix sp. Mg75]|uniref:gamma-glutamyl-gamma-aminobutyrate hydrolase family protein n=1 Tax=Saccharothrix sp. Mg75 TaxID=3445357 RepID=UPI003EEF1406
MTDRPLVALAAASERVDGVPHVAVREVYVRALEQVSGCAVVVVGGPAPALAHVVDRFDGVVFGGHQSDVLPRWYGGGPERGRVDPHRDELALNLIPAALRAGVPVLGVCRGLQELNVALGGTLRDVDGHAEDPLLPRNDQYLPAHPVTLAAGGVLRGMLDTPSVDVNSLHHQAVDRLAPGLRVEAVAPDGVVEAVSTGGPAFGLAVQWHPEWYATTDDVSVALFRGFGAAAAAHAARRAVV